MIARHYILKGQVQGVGFRYFTYKVGHELGIKGWVRNLWNGDVEIHAEGNDEALQQFLDRIKAGPHYAVVENVRVDEVEMEYHPDFSIEG